MTGPDAKAHFALIEQHHKAQVDAALSPLGTLLWRPLPEARESHIAVVREVSPADPSTWPELDDWLSGTLRTMHDLLRPIVKGLDASEWQAAPTDGLGRRSHLRLERPRGRAPARRTRRAGVVVLIPGSTAHVHRGDRP